MDFFSILTLIGGLALFLYGMHVMGDGLSKVSGGKMEQILERTSFWGMQIQDRPDLTLPGEVQEYLEQLK